MTDKESSSNWGKAFGKAFFLASEKAFPAQRRDTGHDYVVYLDSAYPMSHVTRQALSFEHAWTIASMEFGRSHIVQIVRLNQPRENEGEY